MPLNLVKLKYLSDKKDKIIPIIIFIFGMVFLSTFIITKPTNGDSYAYAYSIQHLEGPSLHRGYYYTGHLIYLFTKLLSLSPLFTLSLISLIFGALAIVLIYLFIFKISQNVLLGLFSSLILLFSGGFWFYSIHGEVYIPHLAFVLLSIIFAYDKRPIMSSGLLLLAISITPTSVLAVPAIIFIIYLRKFNKKQKFFFSLPLLLPAFFISIFRFSVIEHIVDFAVYSPRIFLKNFSVFSLMKRIIIDLAYVYGKSFGILNFVAIFGFFYLYRENRNLFWMMLLLIVPFTLYIFNLGLLTEDHLIITFIPMSVFISYGFWRGLVYFKLPAVAGFVILALLISTQVWLSFEFYISPEMKRSDILKNTIDSFSLKYEANSILISDWDFGMAFWYLTQKETKYSLLTGRPVKFFRKDGMDREKCLERLKHSFWIDIPNLLTFLGDDELKEPVLQNNRKLYFIDRKYRPSWIVRSISPEELLNKKEKERQRMPRFVHIMEKALDSNLKIMEILDFSLETIYKFDVVPRNNLE